MLPEEKRLETDVMTRHNVITRHNTIAISHDQQSQGSSFSLIQACLKFWAKASSPSSGSSLI